MPARPRFRGLIAVPVGLALALTGAPADASQPLPTAVLTTQPGAVPASPASASPAQAGTPQSGVAQPRASGQVPRLSDALNHDTSAPLFRLAQPHDGTASAQRDTGLRGTSLAKGAQPHDFGLRADADDVPAQLSSFDGMADPDGILPADPTGDVGPTHYVQAVNRSFAVFTKTGQTQLAATPLRTLWSQFGGPCETTAPGGAPMVAHDQLADRWVLARTVTPHGADAVVCVAVSATSDPTGSYHRYAFEYGAGRTPIRTALGVWPDGYYLTSDVVDSGDPDDTGAQVCALDRARMLAGDPAAEQCFRFPGEASLLPADLDGSTPPPGGSPAYLLGEHRSDTAKLTLYRLAVDWTDRGRTRLDGPVDLAVKPFTRPCVGTDGGRCVPQQGTDVRLESHGNRLMDRVAYRNLGTSESVLASHTVAAGTAQTGIGWYEIRNPAAATPTVHQDGLFSPDPSTFRWLASAAMDRDGNVALGYSASGASLYPSIRVAGRLASDPLGAMPLSEQTVVDGGAPQRDSAGRWGSASALRLDPQDDCTFWYTSQYLAAGETSWRTRIASFPIGSCGVVRVPAFTVEPKSLAFGNVAMGASAAHPLIVTNTGTADLVVGPTSMQGEGAASFRVDADTCAGSTLAPERTCQITVSFRPTRAGPKPAEVVVSDNAEGSPHWIPVTGTGLAALPGAPGRPVAGRFGSGRLQARWQPPAVDGGAAIAAYEARAATAGAATHTCQVAGSQRACTFRGLRTAKPYTVIVRARNEAGWSAWSPASRPAAPLSLPGPPGRPRVTPARAGRYRVVWRAPGRAGGDRVREYIAVASGPKLPTRICRSGPRARGCSLTQLRPGRRYAVRVHARNRLGWGSWSRVRTLKARS